METSKLVDGGMVAVAGLAIAVAEKEILAYLWSSRLVGWT